MTIQRQYSLPNCTLAIEGLGDVISLSSTDPRPPVAVLINAECRLAGQEQPLAGGREFLDSLVRAVSQYVQALLSGFHGNPSAKAENPLVQLHTINSTTHRLSVRSPALEESLEPVSRDIDLNTVQLFDLVEAIDQLLADTQTLPDLTLNLKPLSRREIAKTEPMAKRVIPAAIGVSSLAAAAVVFSLLPVPKVDPPKDLYPVRSTTATPETSPSPGTSPTAGASPQTSPTTSAASPSPAPTASPDVKQLEANLTAAPEITNAADLSKLGQQLREQIEKSWTSGSSLPQDLIYRVGVNQDGVILGYKPVNSAALQNAQKTPLLNLVARQGDRSATTDPLAQFKVSFTKIGGVEVTPWRQAMTSPVSGVTEITAAKELEEILPKLQTQINENWPGTPTVDDELIFKVRVHADGTVVDYSPENDAAARVVEETPFAKLGKPIADNSSNAESPTEPVALFKVVFKPPDGATEISPWRGWSD